MVVEREEALRRALTVLDDVIKDFREPFTDRNGLSKDDLRILEQILKLEGHSQDFGVRESRKAAFLKFHFCDK